MKLLIAPDSFKGTLTAAQASSSIADGIRDAIPNVEILLRPIADGGEGTVDAILQSKPGTKYTINVTSPLGNSIDAEYAILEDKRTAIIEMAAASGLTLVPESLRNVMRATTFGTGELIADALDRGVDHIYVGLGGSATCDGGLGCAQALGYRFLDDACEVIAKPAAAIDLPRIQKIDRTEVNPRLSGCKFTALCDVRNRLCGETGAARVFAPQKGATPEDVSTLDIGLTHFAKLIEQDLSIDVQALDRGGAAGGLAAGLTAFCNAELSTGALTVFDMIDLETAIDQADAVFTGEGRLDATTLNGKAPLSLALLCHAANKPVFALVGQIAEPTNLWEEHFTAVDALGGDPSSYSDHASRLRNLSKASALQWLRFQ